MKYPLIALTILINLLSSTTQAGEAKRTAINLLMEKSGIAKQVDQIPTQLLQSIKQKAAQSVGSPSIVFQSLTESISYAYKTDAIKKEVSNTLYDHLTDDDVVYILKWFASDIGQNITATEISFGEDSITPNGKAEMTSFMERLKMAPAESGRINLINRLDNATLATKFMVDTTINTSTAFMKAMQKTIPTARQDNNANLGKQIEDQLESQRKSLEPIFKDIVSKIMLYTYRNVSDEDLSAYVNFCNSPTGRKFYQTSFAALRITLSKVNTKMADYFASKIQLETPPSNSPYAMPNTSVPMPPMN